MKKATKSQWILFSVVAAIYLTFVIWDGNYWLLFGLPVIFDIYISKFVPWGAWKNAKNKSVRKIAEWADAIIFALVAVYFINIFIFQNYKIPSSSLEKSLLVGDYLFVSKLSFGPRVPNTPLSFPLAQHTLPIVETKSYIEWPQWGYKRLKGLGHVERNDIVVFNYPAGDTVALKIQNPDYYTSVYYEGRTMVATNKMKYGDIVYRPVDRRENYVKRCIGMPGDSLQIIDNQVYIDGKALPQPKKVQFNYFVETKGGNFSEKQFRQLGISKEDRGIAQDIKLFEFLGIEKNDRNSYNTVYYIPLTPEALQFLQKSEWAKSIHIESDFGDTRGLYPIGNKFGWTRDNYGPVWIPQKGASIELNDRNLQLYSRCIINYEGNSLEKKGGRFFINGAQASHYTFKYDYYFMLGDNRHKSADSRYWGFVPEDHVVGKPILIWLSLDQDRGWFDGKIRWNRLFRTVSAQ
ncbi:signal peptidase I [Bacteroidia bacterium]|nr:signal peptidase I [Bacteroidia bacterium]